MPRVPQEIYDRIDNALYDAESDQWWRPDSSFYQIKVSFNPIRVGYIRAKLFGDLNLDPKGKKALEVGCGGGLLCEEIARMGFEITGLDPSLGSLRAARGHVRKSGLNVGYVRGVGEALPCGDESYDVVFACDVLEHVRDLPLVVSEISRVLRPGGVFCYDTLNRTGLSKLAAIKVGQEWKRWAFLPRDLHVWRMFIRPREMKSLLGQNHLSWKEHRGMKPNVPLLTALRGLRRRAKGEWTYAELAQRIQLVESRVTAVMYMGYAVKS